MAQMDTPSLTVGFFAPYGVQYGGKVAWAFTLKDYTKIGRSRVDQLRFSPQVSYFVFPEVQRNVLINGAFLYQRLQPEKALAPMAALGFGYLLARQNQEGTVNLGTGEIDFVTESRHSFVPTLGLGVLINPQKRFGFYLKGFYGRKITAQYEDGAFFGLNFGLRLAFISKK